MDRSVKHDRKGPPGWEPEPLLIPLDVPERRPDRRDDEPDRDRPAGAVVIVIDLA